MKKNTIYKTIQIGALILLGTLALCCCGRASQGSESSPQLQSGTAEAPADPAATATAPDTAATLAEPGVEELAAPTGKEVLAYTNGQARPISEEDAREQGLTVIDLSNYWVPLIFTERDSDDEERQPNEFRPIFLKLANDWPYESRTEEAARKIVDRRKISKRKRAMARMRRRGIPENEIRAHFGLKPKKSGTDSDTAEEEELLDEGTGAAKNYLEVYGIPPTLSVLRKRVLEEEARTCYAEIDYDLIRNFTGYLIYENKPKAVRQAKRGKTSARRVEKSMARFGVEDPWALLEIPKNRVSKKEIEYAAAYKVVREVQKLLLCGGYYPPGTDESWFIKGAVGWKTHEALSAFEKRHRIFAWGVIGEETTQALAQTPEERLHATLLRVIAERAADAAGIVEDGSATTADGKPATYTDEAGVEHPVPNLVAEFTAHVVRHLGVGSPAGALQFLKSHDDAFFNTLRVAIQLPELPPYYGEAMELSAEINKGDTWFEYPYNEEGRLKGQGRDYMPLLRLYVNWNEQKIPLVMMNTTIGGWRTEMASDGYVYLKYKNSEVGPRIWKDIVAGPVWLPPPSAPPAELLKTVDYRGHKVKVPNYDEFGPWYTSAYGLVAAFHVKPIRRGRGQEYFDNGIRTHGSFDYNSILRRYSHGCHRLYNHLAIRIFDFVLRHRPYTRKGKQAIGFGRTINVEEESFDIRMNSKGYLFELEEPMPMEVLKGRVVGRQRHPIPTFMPKPGVEYGPDAQFLPEEFQHLMTGAPKETDTAAASADETAATPQTAEAAPAPAPAPTAPEAG